MTLINPLTRREPICVCIPPCNINKRCSQVLRFDPKDTRSTVSGVFYGPAHLCDSYVHTFNSIRKQQPVGRDDVAFRLIAISHKELTKGLQKKETYPRFVDKVFKNIITIFDKYVGYETYKQAEKDFKPLNIVQGELIQPNPYICPTWDLFGGFDDTIEQHIRLLILRNKGVSYKRYRYCTGNASRCEANDKGTIHSLLKLFIDDGKIVKDRKIILQVLAPNGLWVEKRNGAFCRYSDLQIGLSAKGRVKIGETLHQALQREIQEEVGLNIHIENIKKSTFLCSWKTCKIYSLDLEQVLGHS